MNSVTVHDVIREMYADLCVNPFMIILFFVILVEIFLLWKKKTIEMIE